MESTTSADSREPQFVAAGDIRKRLSDSIAMPKKKFNVSEFFAYYLLLTLSVILKFSTATVIMLSVMYYNGGRVRTVFQLPFFRLSQLLRVLNVFHKP